MTKLMAGVVALAVSVAAAAAMAQTSVAPESQLMATPSASDEVRAQQCHGRREGCSAQGKPAKQKFDDERSGQQFE